MTKRQQRQGPAGTAEVSQAADHLAELSKGRGYATQHTNPSLLTADRVIVHLSPDPSPEPVTRETESSVHDRSNKWFRSSV